MATAALQPRRGLKWVFSGSQGLRAGWGLALFALLTLVIGLAFLTALFVVLLLWRTPAIHLPKLDADTASQMALTPGLFAIVEGPILAALGLATLIMARIERRPLGAYGFARKGMVTRFLQGLLTGGALLAVLIGLLWIAHGLRFGGDARLTSQTISLGLQWAGCFLLVAAVEEVAMRGYVLQTLARGLSFRWAAVISSGVFMLLHLPNGGESPLGLFQVFLIGLVFSFSVWRTGAIWWAIGYHAAWDWAQSFLFGVADSGLVTPGALLSASPIGPAWLSGGGTGPEGSVLMFAILAASLAIMGGTLKTRDHPSPFIRR